MASSDLGRRRRAVKDLPLSFQEDNLKIVKGKTFC
jgi:hypothetical protein